MWKKSHFSHCGNRNRDYKTRWHANIIRLCLNYALRFEHAISPRFSWWCTPNWGACTIHCHPPSAWACSSPRCLRKKNQYRLKHLMYLLWFSQSCIHCCDLHKLSSCGLHNLSCIAVILTIFYPKGKNALLTKEHVPAIHGLLILSMPLTKVYVLQIVLWMFVT